MLELNDVCRYFGGVKAVDGLSLQVRRGEILGVLGVEGVAGFGIVVVPRVAAPLGRHLVAHGVSFARRAASASSSRWTDWVTTWAG